MEPAMDLPIGRIRGIRACASARGTFGVLALDHRQNLRKELRPADPASVTAAEMIAFKRTVVRELGSTATGVLLDPEIGAAQAVVDGSLPAGCGLLVAIEATGYEGPSTARISRVLDGWSVAKAKRMGASAAKLLVYYHPDASNVAEQERLVAGVAAECAAADLPLFIEPLSYSIDPTVPTLTGEDRRRVVVETARRLTRLGGDILKTEFPYDPAVTDEGRWAVACAELDAATALPWVLLSGGVDDATFEAQVRAACRAGASGVLVGRSVWADAASLPPADRPAFLRTTGRARLERLVTLVDELGTPWDARPGPLRPPPDPGDDWYRGYPG
ncbi:MAG: tagatose 1,6-diphosphate aldolase [Chloroflexota bacterium]|jgi:tagatose-1,6-bisphosphate aldolase|nr:tagatose 1,6-diphosphate aldolase [Chloroflexota bacterium]